MYFYYTWISWKGSGKHNLFEKDKDINIQGYAINCIKSFGAEGELIFIEGFTKDSNYLARINCGLGLPDNGIHNMRTLLLVLQDKNKNMRNDIEKVIIWKCVYLRLLIISEMKDS